MAWIGAHFAVGVACGGALAASVCAARRRGWKVVPWAMIAGGFWAVLPDLPHTIRQDLPGTLLARWFGGRDLTAWLHGHANLFFFHGWLDVNYEYPWWAPRWGLRGLALVLLSYNLLTWALFRAVDRQKALVAALQQHLAAARRGVAGDQQHDKRREPRRLCHQPVHAIVLDYEQRSLRPLGNVELLDYTEDGLSLACDTVVRSGQFITLTPTGASAASRPQAARVDVVVLEAVASQGRCRARCRRIAGARPQRLLEAA